MTAFHVHETQQERRKMTTQLDQPSAKIYAFPAGGRAAHRAGKPAPLAPQYEEAPCGSGWYHEAAVEEAEMASKVEKLLRMFDRR